MSTIEDNREKFLSIKNRIKEHGPVMLSYDCDLHEREHLLYVSKVEEGSPYTLLLTTTYEDIEKCQLLMKLQRS